MNKCQTPCIFYNEVKTPTVKPVCDFKDKNIFDMSNEEIQKCEHFRTYNQNKENHKKIFQINS